MYISPKQFIASIIIASVILIAIVRMVQKGNLDIAYCWLWLGIGVGIVLIVTQYEWLITLSNLIGAKTHTTALFIMGFVVLLLMCLQFSLVISTHRRQIKKLTQQIARLSEEAAERGASKETEDA